jgi:hypothetical protein
MGSTQAVGAIAVMLEIYALTAPHPDWILSFLKAGSISRMLFNHARDKSTQYAFALHAVKTVDLLTVTVGNHRWKTAYLMPSGDLHVFIRIDHRQQKTAII